MPNPTQLEKPQTMNRSALTRTDPTGLPMRYLLVTWLFVISAVAYLDRTNISIAGVQIGKEFKIDNTHLGWVFSAFLIGYAAFQIPSGLLVRRFGSRPGRTRWARTQSIVRQRRASSSVGGTQSTGYSTRRTPSTASDATCWG